MKALLLPVYAAGLCMVMYCIGIPKDRWDKLAARVDKKYRN